MTTMVIRMVITRYKDGVNQIWDVKEMPLTKCKEFANLIAPDLMVVDCDPAFMYELRVVEWDETHGQGICRQNLVLFKSTPKGCRKPRACVTVNGQTVDAKAWVLSFGAPSAPSKLEEAIEAAELAIEDSVEYGVVTIETSFLKDLVMAARSTLTR